MSCQEDASRCKTDNQIQKLTIDPSCCWRDRCILLRDGVYSEGKLNQISCVFFFFQAEDGIRDLTVTGVQTCALPIYAVSAVDGVTEAHIVLEDHFAATTINDGVAARAGFVATFDGEAENELHELQIGRASCRERV